jgi:ABC-type uncharacterized transport system permease subunit
MSVLSLRNRRLVSVEARGRSGVLVQLAVPALSIAAAAIVGAVLISLTGHSPTEAYARMLASAFGGSRPVINTLLLVTPLLLTGLAAAVAFKMQLWNIGADGQLIFGAIAASGVGLAIGHALPAPVAVLSVVLAGSLAGALWALLAAIPRAYLRTSEVISTLMLNFIAAHLMNYLIFGSVSFWRDRKAVYPHGREIPESAWLPQIWGGLHAGFIAGIGLALLIWWVLRRTRWGFEVRTIGDSVRAASYAGMSVSGNIVAVLAVSGGLAGLAGAIEVSGVTRSLEPPALSTGLGFTGIVVAALARLSPVGMIPSAILLAGLLHSQASLQVLGIPFEIGLLFQGIILLFVAGGEFLLHNRVRFGGVLGGSRTEKTLEPSR